jgi:AhpD family alkylhydroperoxidase
MQSRIKNPAMLLPDAMPPMQALNSVLEKSGLSPTILGLVHLRVSQVNGCSVCVDLGWRQLRRIGETDERIFTVSAWRDTPYFTDAEPRPESQTGLTLCPTRCGMRQPVISLSESWPL